MKISNCIFYSILVNFIICFNSYAKDIISSKRDINQVIEYNKTGYNNRLTNPQQTLIYAKKALQLAQSINYINGIAESYRIKGIGNYYCNQSDTAIQSYLTALNYYERSKNQDGIAKVYNNIGNLYRDVDYDKGLEYFQKSLQIAQKLNIKDLIAGLYLNIGTIYQKKSMHSLALSNFNKSYNLFNSLHLSIGTTQCLQNSSIVYKDLNQLDKAEKYAIMAIRQAKEHDLNITVAITKITLSKIYTLQNRFGEAEKSIQEGIAYSTILNDSRLLYDFLYNSYALENKRKNYQKALEYLTRIYKQDSSSFKNKDSERLVLQQIQFKQKEQAQENLILKANQERGRILVWSSVIVTGLLLFLILLLVRSVSKKISTNKKLTSLNQEISLQKENLDRINHNLEDIIDERTKDLKIKNKKLSDYSSHLSHQIRGPVATIKGLMNLEKEALIDQDEFIRQMEKCINDIDDRILNINEMLHDPQKYGFNNDTHY